VSPSLVVGTTSDYIALLHQRFQGRCLFLTDARHRAEAAEPPPDAPSEVLADLTEPDEAIKALRGHLARHGLSLSGVACYDDESMALASRIAREHSLPYPSAEAVANCRSKFACKQAWSRAGLPCPQSALVRTEAEARAVLDRLQAPIVLKPLTGSGSELVFFCANARDLAAAFQTIQRRLATHGDARMYASQDAGPDAADPRRIFTVEEFVEGDEYSCDFLLDGGRIEIIRIARKIPARDQAFGTTLAYVVPADLPLPLDRAAFARQVGDAARAVGLQRAIGMLDCIVRGGEALMIEMAPRPGGDCLPPLIRRSSGFDTLGAELDLAEGRAVVIPPPSQWRRLVGLRFFASQAGVVRELDLTRLRADARVLECSDKYGPGHRVVLPPEDWDSRILGHAIFEPNPDTPIEPQSLDLAAKVRVHMEPAP
jgi:biotin carboxylase